MKKLIFTLALLATATQAYAGETSLSLASPTGQKVYSAENNARPLDGAKSTNLVDSLVRFRIWTVPHAENLMPQEGYYKYCWVRVPAELVPLLDSPEMLPYVDALPPFQQDNEQVPSI